MADESLDDELDLNQYSQEELNDAYERVGVEDFMADENFDPAEMTEEDRLAALEEFENPSEETEPAETVTSESEEKIETESEETATSEVASEEEQPTEEPVEKLYAGKYRTIEDLEAAYNSQKTEAERIAHERNELLQKLAEQEQSETEQGLPQKEEVTPEKELFFDQAEYDRILYENGEAMAQAYLFEAYDKYKAGEREQQELRHLEDEARQYNETLGQQRAKELLFEYAKGLNDKTLMDRYGNSDYKVTAEDLEAVPTVLNQLLAEHEVIEQNFKREPIKLADKVVSLTGRWPKNVYKKANLLLNHDKIVEQKIRETADGIIHDIKNAKPKAKVITPSGTTKAEINVKFTGYEDEDEARKKAAQMTDEERRKLLDSL